MHPISTVTTRSQVSVLNNKSFVSHSPKSVSAPKTFWFTVLHVVQHYSRENKTPKVLMLNQILDLEVTQLTGFIYLIDQGLLARTSSIYCPELGDLHAPE